MNVRDFVLLALGAMGGQVRGKTKLQKQVYFVAQLTRTDVPLGFRAHYYGPYSVRVENALDELWSLGLIEKRTNTTGQPGDRGYERVRYDFSLTDFGRRAIAQVREACPAEAQAVDRAAETMRRAGGVDLHYMDLAAAAKTHFILRQSGKSMHDDEISATAAKLDWQLGTQQIEDAADFLMKLHLARTTED